MPERSQNPPTLSHQCKSMHVQLGARPLHISPFYMQLFRQLARLPAMYSLKVLNIGRQ